MNRNSASSASMPLYTTQGIFVYRGILQDNLRIVLWLTPLCEHCHQVSFIMYEGWQQRRRLMNGVE